MMTTAILLAAFQNIIVGLLCMAAAGVAGVAAFFYIRAKNREKIDPALSAGEPRPSANGIGEMRELTSRIEDIVLQQQDNGETQRQHLSRKIDSVKESVESQHHAVTGLRQELRHEVQRRDAEIHEIRSQIDAVRDGVGLPPAERTALPPAVDLGAPEAEGPLTPLAFESDDASGMDGYTPFEDVTFDDETPTVDNGADSLFSLGGFEETPIESGSPTGPLLFENDAIPSFQSEDDQPLAFEEQTPFAFEEMPDPFSFSEAEAPFEQDATPLTFESEEPPAFAFTDEPEGDSVAPLMFEEADLPALNDPDPLGFEEVDPMEFVDIAPEAPLAFEESEIVDAPSPETSAPEMDATPAYDEIAPMTFSEAPAFQEEPAFQEASAESDAAAAPEAASETAPTLDAAEPIGPLAFEAAMTEAEAEPAPLAFEAEEIEEAEPVGAFEIVSFISPESEEADKGQTLAEPAEAIAFSAEEIEEPVGAIHFEAEEMVMTHVPAEHVAQMGGVQTPVAPEARADAFDGASFEAPDAQEAPEADSTAWISRPERDQPTEEIGGIMIEQVGDVPVAPEAFSPETLAPETLAPEAFSPDTLAPESLTPDAASSMASAFQPLQEPAEEEPVAAPIEFLPASVMEPAVDDEFPAPVVANDLLAEPSFEMDEPVIAADGTFTMEIPGQIAPTPEPAAIPEPAATAEPMPAAMAPEGSSPEAAPIAEISEPVQEPVAEAPAPEEEEVYTAPEGAEDLTAITTVDEEVCRELYKAGVLTLDEIARWGRSDARKISSQIGVSEETIMNQWVFEAQAALFDRFSR